MTDTEGNQLIRDLTLILLYLTSWKEDNFGFALRRSWKGYGFGVLNEFEDQDLVSGSRRSKSVYLSDKGIEAAKELLEKYGLGKYGLGEQ